MSIRFLGKRVGARSLGAIVAGTLNLVLVGAAGLLVAATRGGALPVVLLAVLGLLLAVPLGWSFAPRALTPGTGNALTAAAGITAVAVPIGALILAMGFVAGASDLSFGEKLGGLIFVLVGGLVLFGLPLACLTFVVAGVWVALLRAAAVRSG